MAGMSEAAVKVARERMAQMNDSAGITPENISSRGTLITLYMPEGTRIISRDAGEAAFTMTEHRFGEEPRSHSLGKITGEVLTGGVVEGSESSSEMVFALIARGVSFPIAYAVEG